MIFKKQHKKKQETSNKMSSKTRAYGYWTIQLFGSRVAIPCKFMKVDVSTDEEKRIPLKQTFSGRPVRTIKILATDDKGSDENPDKVVDVSDVERVIQFSEIEKAILKDGKFMKISEFNGLDVLMTEHHNKKWKDRNVEVIGCYPMNTLGPMRFNGRQFVLCPGASSKEKVPSDANIKLFKCLQDYLKKTYFLETGSCKKYLHVRFSSNCCTAQELGALYVDENGLMRISGLHADIDINEINFPVYDSKVDEQMLSVFGQKMEKVYDDKQKEPEYNLPWFDHVRKSLEEFGVREKFVEKKSVDNSVVNENLMDALMSL